MRRFGAIGIAMAASSVDYFAMALALPDMAADLRTTAANLQWSVSLYMIAIGITMVPGSRLGDLIGRKKVFLIGLAMFGLASLWIGLSPNAGSVIAARVVQGLGAGLFYPVAFSLVSNATSKEERPRILGLLSGIGGIGAAAGPILGGVFASTIGWRWVFLINVPLAAAGVIWGHYQLKESKDLDLADKKLRNMDWIGMVLLALLVAGISLAIDDMSTDDVSFMMTTLPGIIGLIALVAFIIWERRSTWPMLPPSMWKIERFTAIVIAASIASMGMSVMIFLSTLYLQDSRGLSGIIAGLMFIPAAIGRAIGGPSVDE